MSKKYTYKQGFKPKDEIQISIIKKDIPGLHGDLIPKVQLVMDAWLKYSTLKQYLVDKYSDVPPFNGEPFTEATPKRSGLYEKVLAVLKKLPIADNPDGSDRYGIDGACAELEDIFIKEIKQAPYNITALESQPSEQKPSEDSSKEGEVHMWPQKSQEIAQWVIDNLWPKELSDFELYTELAQKIEEYAQQSMKQERDMAIQECIEAATEGGTVRKDLIKTLEKLKSKTI